MLWCRWNFKLQHYIPVCLLLFINLWPYKLHIKFQLSCQVLLSGKKVFQDCTSAIGWSECTVSTRTGRFQQLCRCPRCVHGAPYLPWSIFYLALLTWGYYWQILVSIDYVFGNNLWHCIVYTQSQSWFIVWQWLCEPASDLLVYEAILKIGVIITFHGE